ncbi:MAG: GRAM domain-containing protein [Bacillota bacterium]
MIYLEKGERILKEGMASYMKGLFSLNGKLYLTDQRLVFQSHSAYDHTDAGNIDLHKISYIKPSHTRLVIPNGLSVTLDTGKIETFAVNNPKDWLAKIQKLRKANSRN